jgi:glyoxylase-like metal-dependent hydrolase (beta-lactamase superfamily II)
LISPPFRAPHHPHQTAFLVPDIKIALVADALLHTLWAIPKIDFITPWDLIPSYFACQLVKEHAAHRPHIAY